MSICYWVVYFLRLFYAGFLSLVAKYVSFERIFLPIIIKHLLVGVRIEFSWFATLSVSKSVLFLVDRAMYSRQVLGRGLIRSLIKQQLTSST